MVEKYYYALLKNGDIRQYVKPPKRKHLTMTVETIDRDNHVTEHTIICGKTTSKFIARCGYDRGPRLDQLMVKILRG